MNFCKFLIVTCVVISAAYAEEQSFQECFQKDSISCMQMMVRIPDLWIINYYLLLFLNCDYIKRII